MLLYGNADLSKELAFIDKEYLSKYERSKEKVEIPLQKPFEAKKVAEKPYAVAEGSSTKNNTFLSLSIVTGRNTDVELVMALNILREALVNHESAPIRLALQEAKIGKDVRASVSDIQQNVFQITVQNANPEDRDKFDEIVYSTMKKASTEGFDKKMIEGIINRMEFGLRENNNPQKGFMYTMRSQKSMFFANNPIKGLEFEDSFGKC
ncbi:MAG: insulinase family protein [Marinilabiliales bacterium]|nr:insulinase family protein [Marinilabiliales bacterium]